MNLADLDSVKVSSNGLINVQDGGVLLRLLKISP